MSRAVFLTLVVLMVGACGDPPPEPGGAIRLAAGFRPSPVEPTTWPAEGEREIALRSVDAGDREGAFVEIRVPIAGDEWLGADGTWATPETELFSVEEEPGTLLVGETQFAPMTKRLRPGTFEIKRGRIRFQTDSEERPDVDGSYTVQLSLGAEENGAWRMRAGSIAGDAIPVLPGLSEELVVDVPPGSVLRFATAARRSYLPDDERTRYRVRLDGELLFDHSQAGGAEWHALPLPAAGVRGARLVFEVGGPPLLAAFFAPVIGPAEPPVAGADERADERPDLVLFMADTFRADNLSLYGGPSEIAPEVERFAEQSIRFTRAWSPASWTAPAHASMFTGLFPPQHAVMTTDDALTRSAHTLAEQLAAHGYRTGGITDGGNVSLKRGLDQGFEWWDQRKPDDKDEALGLLRARVDEFLEADDGRPTFLFVQSYRAHTPFEACEPTREELAGLIGEPRTFKELEEEMDRDAWETPRTVPDHARATVEEVGRLYRGGSRDLSRGFGVLLDDLARHGLGDAFVVFTSDHGEAFAEHGGYGHGGGVHEELIRIPLFIHGPGLAPADVHHSATLVDLPRTLCELAAVPSGEGWLGRSLLRLDADRAVFAFAATAKTRHRATIEGGRKLILRREGEGPLELHELYDLSSDARETVNLREGEASAEALTERAADQLRTIEMPLLGADAMVLDEATREELEALGYL